MTYDDYICRHSRWLCEILVMPVVTTYFAKALAQRAYVDKTPIVELLYKTSLARQMLGFTQKVVAVYEGKSH